MNTNVNQQKELVQNQVLKAIEDNPHNSLIALATGVGKSKVAIKYLVKHRPENVLLIVPTVPLRENDWQKEFAKWGYTQLYNKLERECYAYIHKIKGRHYDLVIMDEGHNITPSSG